MHICVCVKYQRSNEVNIIDMLIKEDFCDFLNSITLHMGHIASLFVFGHIYVVIYVFHKIPRCA